jgi:transcription-repair coupling factor (superfamily II helicase)
MAPRCCAPIAEALARKGARPCLTGLHGSTAGFALTQLMHPPSGPGGAHPWLIVTKNDEAAARLFDDLRFYHDLSGLPETSLALFPRWETLPYEATAPHVGLIARRMNALREIGTRPAAKVVTSIDALMQRLMPVETFVRTVLTFKIGGAIERGADSRIAETGISPRVRRGDPR